MKAAFVAFHDETIINFYRAVNHAPYDNVVSGNPFRRKAAETD